MEIRATKLESVVIVEANAVRDSRGFFVESWNQREFMAHGLDYVFVQDNHSRSGAKVLRGLHYQDMTAPQGKLVRCTFGAIFDVAVDLRFGSPTLGQWVGVELSADNFRQLMIPPGFAHGFATLTEAAEVQYKCTGFYAPRSEGSIRWDDPDIGIRWPFADPVVSARDSTAKSFKDYLAAPCFVYDGVKQ
jgi:dTDP-4-dehydrorhamnose 3,5-epimerase